MWWLRVFSSIIISLSFLPSSSATLTSCVTCSSCKDIYDGTDSNISCSATVSDADSCQKTRIQLPGTTYVLKTCAKSCQEQSIVAGPVRFDVTCCSTNNCNEAIVVHPRNIWILFICGSVFLWQHWFTNDR